MKIHTPFKYDSIWPSNFAKIDFTEDLIKVNNISILTKIGNFISATLYSCLVIESTTYLVRSKGPLF